ncbi:hypothetical protein DSL72_004619 [Monilinia vaccinii-corymbosi]|uniref:Uncharacterized protein n=1 Tax=Monilinia vaccinii-corymbosi TaxID=61207 RepID=A0A8A3P8Y1_9HELO|nr:hypothetical protein DSL72_004619 [Monilinia vaccinii-corymbosi]
MVNFNIHWKGCPHRNFPRIDNTPSCPDRNSTRCASHANRGTCKIHNCRALEQARRKQRIEARSRKSRTSRASTVTRSQRRASKQARQEVFGWESPCSNIARQDQQSASYFPISETIVDSKTPRPSEIIVDSPGIDSVDGPCSAFRRIKACVANKNIKSQAGTRSNSFDSRQLTGGPADQLRRYQAIPRTPGSQSSRVRDSRSLYRKYNPFPRTGFTSPARSKAFLAASTLASLYEERGVPSKTPKSGDPIKKESSSGNTAFIGAPRLASLAQGKSFSSSVHSIVQSVASSPSSRSPSQRRALKRFTRELDLYLQIAKQTSTQTPIPSVLSNSFSSQTIQTIQEFKPYHAEFQAAGLAVTSAEQRNQSGLDFRLHERRNTVPEAQPLAHKLRSSGLLGQSEIQRRRTLSDIEEPQAIVSGENMGIQGSNLLTKKSVPDSVKAGRELSSMTVVESTPEHERGDLTDRLEPPPCCDLARPIMRASSPAKVYRAESVVSPKLATSPVKKSLPWLRKPPITAESSPESGTATKRTRLNKVAGDATASPPYSEFTSQPNSQSSSIVLNLDTPPEHRRPIPPQVIKTPTSIASSTTSPYPQPSVGPKEGGEIGVVDFASLEQLPKQTRAALTNGDTIAQTDIRLLKNHATQTSAAPSFITRAPHFTTQIPVTVQSQQRRGLVLKSSVISESQRPQLPQEAKTIGIPEPAPSHQISRAASAIATSYVPPSPLHCIQCNGELSTSSESRFGSNMTTVPGPSNPKRKNMRMCEIPEAIHCEGCKLSMVNPDTSTKHIAGQSPKRHVRRDAPLYGNDGRRTVGSGSNDKQKEPDISADEGYYALQSDVRKSGGNAASEQIPAPLSDPTKKKSTSELGPPPQAYTTSISIPIQATRSRQPSQSTRPGYVQDQVLSYAKPPGAPVSLDINHKLSVSEPMGDLQNQLASLERRTRQEKDTKKFFKGLRVATAAACEDGVDKFIEEVMGYKVRKMLMDISALDGVGVNNLANVARQTAKKRRADLTRLQMTRISKEERREESFERGFGFDDGDGTWKNSLEEVAKMREKERGKSARSPSGGRRKNHASAEKPSRDRALGLVAGDQAVRLREEAEAAFDEMSARED